ncbi:MAG: sugar ABC transporter permease [Ruminococcus sp.]|nr:sugar ABC transporter permease [Ruminococcus sp.]
MEKKRKKKLQSENNGMDNAAGKGKIQAGGDVPGAPGTDKFSAVDKAEAVREQVPKASGENGGADGVKKGNVNKDGVKKVKKKAEKKGGKISKLTDTNTPFAIATVLPSLIGVMIFFIIPFMIIIWYSFLDNPISRDFVFLKNYGALLGNYSFKMAARNTLILSAVAVPLAVILSLGLAGLLDSRIPCKSMFRTFFLCPMMVPVASIVLIWQVMFHYHGTVNEWLGAWFQAQPVDWMKSSKCLIVVILLFLWKNLGYNMILFLSALSNIPKDLIEVAELEGAGAFYRLVHIKLRYLSPTILFVTILSLINSFKLFREVYLLTGDYPYEDLYLLQHFMNNTFKSLDYQKLSAAAMLMAVVMVIIIGGLFVFENKFGEDVEE